MTGFPKDFIFGAATDAYQIEGAMLEDGKGLSVCDAFYGTPGKSWNNQNGSIACDHYHRYLNDVAIMKEIGLQAYRFSISWPRVMPAGTGAPNAKGIAFYDRLIDALLAAGVQPWATLFHWDYPLELYKRGGWLNPDSPLWFAEYTAVVIDRFSDRITHWLTLNEPQCFIGNGHHSGTQAPGLKLSWAETLQAAHHALLAHGRAVSTIRARAKKPAIVGYAPVGCVYMPVDSDPRNIKAAYDESFAVRAKPEVWNCAWWMDPVYLGTYPGDGVKLYEADMPKIGADDMKTISQPLDCIGTNMYQASYCRQRADGTRERLDHAAGIPLTTYTWPITPDVLYWGPKFLHERYKMPVVITENGMANVDMVFRDGKVHDPQRCEYIDLHLDAVSRAMADGVPIHGYFYWSLMDNFEWEHGYRHRFGLVHVDFESQKRILKDSAYRYRDIIARRNA